ncbi:site-specific integrase [Streptacidiphilus sp. PB12-B1b]|uniref:site-specific integrase n=1 Tax=Streptacidiphilus sp. PB12-B1b TaxID=2705012 RepID=UPI0015FC07F3|nr:site-specific integrase [Streptacidiphilus sp. PB12-B1b]QMU78881.1 site-specific integrase [Streptacidiphilus sp. PB12-B1b]
MAAEIEIRTTTTDVVTQADRDTHLSAETITAIAAGRADSTSRAYRADREAYARWCAAEGRTALPATAETIASYAAHLTTAPLPRTGRPASPSSIDRAMSAISTLHAEHDLPKPSTVAARAVINGFRTRLALAKDPAAKPRKASPAVPTALRAMLAPVDRTTLLGKRDAALVLLGFATAARVSELVAVDVTDLRETDEGLDTSIYRRKVKLFTENVVLYGSDPATCPVRAVQAYTTALVAAGRTGGPLFVRIDRHGRVAPPMLRKGRPIGDPSGRITPEAAADVVTRLADRAGLTGDWSGHSLRRGFATAARLAGHDVIRIGRTGGWADGSRALAGYMEDADRVTASPLVGIGL